MKTECSTKKNEKKARQKIEFQSRGRKEVIGSFDGGSISSDAGALLLREVEKRSGIIEQGARCFTDHRDPGRIEHTVVELVGQRVVLDFDATDDEIHGGREGRFFHGYYGHYCCLPLYVFCEETLLWARLRPSNIDAAKGSVEALEKIVKLIRGQWPGVEIVARADSGFCREELMAWCEHNGVGYALGMSKNSRLKMKVRRAMKNARRRYGKTGEASRAFRDFSYRTRESWTRSRRVVGKAEYIPGKENERFVVTSLSSEEFPARELYEEFYCARGRWRTG